LIATKTHIKKQNRKWQHKLAQREREREREREQFVLVSLLTTHLTIRGNPLSFLLKKTSMTKEHELAKVARSGLKFRNLCFSMAS
jgi:hypothetical protein